MDRELALRQLKDFATGNSRYGLIPLRVLSYEAMRPERRDAFLAAHIELSRTERWAWDVLMEICHRWLARDDGPLPDHPEGWDFTPAEIPPPKRLLRFAMEAAVGQRSAPKVETRGGSIETREMLGLELARDTMVHTLGFKVCDAEARLAEWLGIDADSVHKRFVRWNRSRGTK